MPKKIAIIGAGPIGLEAGLAARNRGYEVIIFERGEVADSIKHWGKVRMFSPFSMNTSEAGRALLKKLGRELPDGDAYLNGFEYAAAYLDPIAQQLPVYSHTSVKSIVRSQSNKLDKIWAPERSDTPFRLLVEHNGEERHEYADYIFDCSGTFKNPNPLGDGGVPAAGESKARDRISYGLGEASDVSPLAGSHLLVVGGGHSAANIIVSLIALPDTVIEWVVRRPGTSPCARIENDPLLERDRVCAAANGAVLSERVTLHDGCTVTHAHRTDKGLEITLLNLDGSTRQLHVDHAVAATGSRPDWSFARELHVQTCWASEGTYPLSASLLGDSGGGDCLKASVFGADTLLHPEPGYFALGTKSYGRMTNFLIATGIQQIEMLLAWLDSPAQEQG